MNRCLPMLLPATLLALFLVPPAPLLAAPTAAVSAGKRVSLEYTLLLEEQGALLNAGDMEPMEYEHGKAEILPALEQALEGLHVGDRKQVTLTPDQGFGPFVEEAIVEVDTEKLPQESRTAGALVQLDMPDGETLEGQVTRISQNRATVDFNHPFAGKTLHFDIKVVAIR